MAFQAVPNAAKAVVRFGYGLQVWTNSLWFTQSAFTTEDLEALAAAVDAGWGAGLLDVMSDQCNYLGTQVYDMRTVDGEIALDSDSAAAGHIHTGDALPLSACEVLTLYTLNRGRSGRGRLYISGMAESQWAAGVFDVPSETNIEAAYVATLSAAYSAGWASVIVSRQLNGVPRTTPLTQAVTSWDVRNRVPGSQRRRVQRP